MMPDPVQHVASDARTCGNCVHASPLKFGTVAHQMAGASAAKMRNCNRYPPAMLMVGPGALVSMPAQVGEGDRCGEHARLIDAQFSEFAKL